MSADVLDETLDDAVRCAPEAELLIERDTDADGLLLEAEEGDLLLSAAGLDCLVGVSTEDMSTVLTLADPERMLGATLEERDVADLSLSG